MQQKQSSMESRRPSLSTPQSSISAPFGWFSIALGITQVLAPRWIAQRSGLPAQRRSAIRLVGLRELATGAFILSRPSSSAGPWARVAGDLINLALLRRRYGGTRANNRIQRSRLVVSAVTAADLACALSLAASRRGGATAPRRERESIVIDKPADEIYRFWRSLEKLPTIMNYLDSITVIDEKRSRWVAKPLGGLHVEWTSEIIADEPNRSISWRSTGDSEISTEGRILFEPLNHERGTRVTLEISLNPLPGVRSLSAPFSKLAAHVAVRRDLRRLKQFMETGEIATIKGQSAGARQERLG